MKTLHPRPSSQQGVSLIEALVALLVLALGILGLVGMQTRALTEARLANARAVAIRMTSDINERMMLNRVALSQSPMPYLVTWAPAPMVSCSTCTPAAVLAQADLSQWKTTLANSLPGGNGMIYQINPGEYGVLIGWTDNVSAAANNTADTSSLTAYSQALAVNTGTAAVNCPANTLCHLVRIRP